jgi:DNA-binding CsgD family transcriptional regulator
MVRNNQNVSNNLSINDSAIVSQKQIENDLEQIRQKLDLLNKEKSFYQNENKKLISLIAIYDKQNVLFVVFSIISIFILIFLVYVFWRYRNRSHKNFAIVESQPEENNIYHSQDLTLVDQNLKLNEIIISKERELTALTMQLANMQDTIGALIDKFTLDLKDSKDSKIYVLSKEIRSVLSQKDYWNEFMIKFTQIHPNFNSNIKALYPALTSKDISFCSLIKLNLSNKEIANLLQVSHESVITKKYLLKKKLALTADQDLFQIVNNIE